MKGWNSTTNPPKELKIGDATTKSKQKAAKPEAVLPATASGTPPTHGFPYAYPPYMLPGPYGPPPPHGSHWAPRYGTHAPTNTMPSSEPPTEDVEDVTLFPRISEWLRNLDDGRRGADGHNFSTFIGYFAEHKYIRISDIADGLTPADLTKGAGMAEGTAKRLISYAEADTLAIRKKEKKRVRDEKAHVHHYN